MLSLRKIGLGKDKEELERRKSKLLKIIGNHRVAMESAGSDSSKNPDFRGELESRYKNLHAEEILELLDEDYNKGMSKYDLTRKARARYHNWLHYEDKKGGDL